MKAPLSNFDFMSYYKNNTKFAGVFSRDNIPTLKDKFYIINLDDQQGPGTHWVIVFNVGESCIYFDSFGVSPAEEILHKMRQSKKSVVGNIYRIQGLSSSNCGFYCIYVIDELLVGRQYIDILTDFDPKNYNKNDDIIKEIF